MIWKNGSLQAGWSYRFNVFRTSTRAGRVSQSFAPADVIHLVKLAQVLAAVIADDGCLNQLERGVLKRLAADLDEFWQRISISADSDNAPSAASLPQKGDSNGNSAGS